LRRDPERRVLIKRGLTEEHRALRCTGRVLQGDAGHTGARLTLREDSCSPGVLYLRRNDLAKRVYTRPRVSDTADPAGGSTRPHPLGTSETPLAERKHPCAAG